MPIDRVAEHRPRHLPVMLVQERVFDFPIALPNFPQHPADRFVDQIMGILEKQPRDLQGRPEFVPLDEIKGRDNRDSPLPDIVGTRKLLEWLDFFRVKVWADDGSSRRINEAPLADLTGLLQV